MLSRAEPVGRGDGDAMPSAVISGGVLALLPAVWAHIGSQRVRLTGAPREKLRFGQEG